MDEIYPLFEFDWRTCYKDWLTEDVSLVKIYDPSPRIW
jgi:hypothetical protein